MCLSYAQHTTQSLDLTLDWEIWELSESHRHKRNLVFRDGPGWLTPVFQGNDPRVDGRTSPYRGRTGVCIWFLFSLVKEWQPFLIWDRGKDRLRKVVWDPQDPFPTPPPPLRSRDVVTPGSQSLSGLKKMLREVGDNTPESTSDVFTRTLNKIGSFYFCTEGFFRYMFLKIQCK